MSIKRFKETLPKLQDCTWTFTDDPGMIKDMNPEDKETMHKMYIACKQFVRFYRDEMGYNQND